MSKSKPLLISTSGVPVPKGNTCAQITAHARSNGFLTGLTMLVSDPRDWRVCDIRIDNRSLFAASGDLPGEMFATSAIDSYLEWDLLPRGHSVVVMVAYNGADPKGMPFHGQLTFDEATSDEVGAYLALKDAVITERRRLARVIAERNKP